MGLESYNTLAELNIAMASVLNPPNLEVRHSDVIQKAIKVICAQNLNIFESASPEEAVKFIKHAVKINNTNVAENEKFLEAMRVSASVLELQKGGHSTGESIALLRELEDQPGGRGNDLYFKTFANWISNNKIPIGSLNLKDEELLKLAQYLTFLDMSPISSLAPKSDHFIEQLAKSALNLNHLIISSDNHANIMLPYLAASTTLTTLTLVRCYQFNQSLPLSLTTLTLDTCHGFKKTLPLSLTTLTLDTMDSFKQPLPSGITTLTISYCRDFNLPLPSNLTALVLRHCPAFDHPLPSRLTTLKLDNCDKINQPLPPTLTRLTLYRCVAFDPNLTSIFVILKCNGVAEAQEALEKEKAEVIIQKYIDESPSKQSFLLDWEAIKCLEDPFIRQQQRIWFAFSVCHAREALSDQQWDWLAKTNLVSAIRTFQTPELRTPLMQLLTQVAQSVEGPEASELLVPAAEKKKSILKIGHLLCAALVQAGIDLATLNLLKARIDNPQGVFVDKFKYTEVVKMLLQLQQESRLSAAEKREILRRACTEGMRVESLTEKAKDAALLTNCRGILMTIEMGKANALTAPQPLLYQIAEACFRDIMSIGQVEGGFIDAYARTCQACRNSQALLIYASKMASLKDDRVMECLGKFVTSVLNSTFAEERYRIQGNPHLTLMSQQFAGWDNLWNLWKTGEKACPPQQTADLGVDAPEKITMHDWLTATIYAHRQETTEIPYLIDYLRPTLNVEGRKNIVEKLKGEIKQRAGLLKGGSPRKEVIRKELAYLNIQNKFLELVLQTNMSEEDQKYKLKYLLTSLNKYMAESTHIIEEVSKKVESLEGAVRVSGSTICVVDSDDPYDLMLSGTEVDGSCQDIAGDPDYSKALLAYLMDGKNRILAVKTAEGPSGKILARCIIRLLWDGEKPVLFCERVYPDNSSYEQDLIEMARRKGQTLDVPVLRGMSADDAGEYLKTVESLGGPAPFEYSDASVEKMNPNGEFTIPYSYYA